MRLKPFNFTNYEGIAFTFGFPVPPAFAQLIGGLYEYSRGDARKVFSLFERLTHLMLDGPNARYQQTPPEMFPIASLGVNGVHYGYLRHAPELSDQDYPVVQLAPMELAGVALVGNSTSEALENIIADVIVSESDEWERQELERLSQMLGLRPDLETAKDRKGIDDYALPVVPITPAGWQYVESSDGAGVLAPAAKFAPEPLAPINPRAGPDWFLEKADRALLSGFPATALYYLREGYWLSWTDRRTAQRFSYRLATAYTELDRPSLAEAAAWRAKKYFS